MSWIDKNNLPWPWNIKLYFSQDLVWAQEKHRRRYNIRWYNINVIENKSFLIVLIFLMNVLSSFSIMEWNLFSDHNYTCCYYDFVTVTWPFTEIIIKFQNVLHSYCCSGLFPENFYIITGYLYNLFVNWWVWL